MPWNPSSAAGVVSAAAAKEESSLSEQTCFSAAAVVQVLPNPLLTVTPERGQVVAEGSAELEVTLLLSQPGPLSTVLELDLRGGKVLKLPIRWVAFHLALQ